MQSLNDRNHTPGYGTRRLSESTGEQTYQGLILLIFYGQAIWDFTSAVYNQI
jgi:hypothetical protein